jgi:hypothetical protein
MGLIGAFKKAVCVGDPVKPVDKLGRNDPCWCGSGKKYRRCHMEFDNRRYSAALAARACKGPT